MAKKKYLLIKELKLRLDYDEDSEDDPAQQIHDFLEDFNEFIGKYPGTPDLTLDSENDEPVFEIKDEDI